MIIIALYEFGNNTDPNNNDTDSDLMPDGWEIYYQLNPTNGTDDISDKDADNLIALYEFGNNTDPNNNDTDSDLMPDGWEIYYQLNPTDGTDDISDKDADNLIAVYEFGNNTDPNNNDTDSDLMPDGWEIYYQLNPTDGTDDISDKDADNLIAVYEYGNGTDPNNSDTDSDLMPDGWEICNQLNPTDGTDDISDSDADDLIAVYEYGNSTDPNNFDTDSDGIGDGEELILGTDNYITDPTNPDTDNDGLTDGEEVNLYNTDPTNADSDGDGFLDGYDFNPTSFFMPTGIILISVFSVISGSLIVVALNHRRKKRREVELKRKKELQSLLEKKPRTSEEGLKQLNQLQMVINQFLVNNQYENAVPFFQKKEKIYKEIIQSFNRMKLKSLIPTLKEERNKNQEILYKTKQAIWARNYQRLTQELKEYQIINDYSKIDETIDKMLEKTNEMVLLAQQKDDSPGEAKYEGIIRELTELKQINHYTEKYYMFEKRYNEVLTLVDKGRISSALEQQIGLNEKITTLERNVQADSEANKELHSISQTISRLKFEVNKLRMKIQKVFEAETRGLAKPRTDFTKIEAKISVPELSDITISGIKAYLQAKIVILGESSVGKTHLVLTMTGREYGERQGSTVGVDKFYKPVNLSVSGYVPELCFWDLGGNWNLRAINELFINDAQIILLIYDVTRPETFKTLQYWLDMVKATRSPEANRIFVVGNKIDVGGKAISQGAIEDFLAENQLSHHRFTSAKEETGIRHLLEDMIGVIDWSDLIKNIDPKTASEIAGILKMHRTSIKVSKTAKLLKILTQKLPSQDRLTLKAALRNFAAQDLLQFGRKDLYVVLDPEFIDKSMARLIRRAADNQGILEYGKGIENWKLGGEQFNALMDYLEIENICFDMGNKKWLFPNVIHKGEPQLKEIDGWAYQILKASPLIENIKFKGPGDLIFSRILVILSREYGDSIYISNISGIWTEGSGRKKSVIFLHFIPSPEGGLIRIRAGGEKGERIYRETINAVNSILKTFGSFKRLEEYDVGQIPSSPIKEIPFKSFNYRDKMEPFLFTSYAHKDSVQVFSEIEYLHNRGINVWYDEGIQPTSDWTNEIATAIEKCTAFIVFISKNSLSSRMVLNEINYALDQGKRVLLIFLQPIELPKGLKLRVSTKQYLNQFELEEKYFHEKLYNALRDLKSD